MATKERIAATRAARAMRCLLPHRALLDPLHPRRHDHPMHEAPRRVDASRIQRARLDELLDLGDADVAGRRGDRIEVARAVSIDEVAEPVAAPRGDEGEVTDDAPVHHVLPAADL